MKYLLSVLLLAVSFTANAHLIAGYGQVTTANSASGAGTSGGSIAVGNGIAGSLSGATATNSSTGNATQSLGVTTTTTNSTTTVGQGNVSGALGNSAAGALTGAAGNGGATAIGGQGFIVTFP